jgi:hypothetical protein
MNRKEYVARDREHLQILKSDFGISLLGSSRRQGLGLTPDLSRYFPSKSLQVIQRLYNRGLVFNYANMSPTVQTLIENFMLFYAVADVIPDGTTKEVTTDIKIDRFAFQYLQGLYNYFDQRMPRFNANFIDAPKIKNSGSNKLSCFSTGKDSTYITLSSKTLPVHVAKLNKATSTREIQALERFLLYLPKQPVIIPAYNSLKFGSGHKTYQMRDGLIYAWMIPIAIENQANTILSGAYFEDAWYSASREGVASLNELFHKKGIGVEVKPIDKISEEEVIRRMINEFPQQFYMTHPCVLDDLMFSIKRKWFIKKFKDYPLMEGSCGVCGKDVELNMARLIHDPLIAKLDYNLQKDVAEYYMQRSKQPNISDFIEPELVEKVRLKYNLI